MNLNKNENLKITFYTEWVKVASITITLNYIILHCKLWSTLKHFLIHQHNLWWTCSIYGEHAQFMVNMLNLWWTCIIYGEHAQFMVSMLNLWWFVQSQLIWSNYWISLEKLPQIDFLQVEIHPLVSKLQWFLFHISWFVQQLCWFDLTIHWAFKNYPPLTPHMLKFHHL